MMDKVCNCYWSEMEWVVQKNGVLCMKCGHWVDSRVCKNDKVNEWYDGNNMKGINGGMVMNAYHSLYAL
jgi:hypothetical protein